MKTLTYFLKFILLVFVLACSKDEEVSPTPPPPTSLELTIQNSIGNPVSGATVKLYTSQTNLVNQTNQVGNTVISDAFGKAIFPNLSNIQYFWFAESNCENNFNGAVTSTSPLTANQTNRANVVLSATGTIRFTSQSSNPYRIFINGTAVADLNGGAFRDFKFRPTGNYTLRVLQLSGFLITPTDITYTGNLSCGGTLIVTFP